MGANEDTISAFEVTDSAEDLRIKNSACLLIDLEGFFVQKKFQVREMGYYSWDEHFDRHAFFQPAALKNLSHKDKKAVNFAKHNIHGHTYQPRYQERAYEHDEVDIVLLRLYSQFKTEKRTVVAYKGGHVEKAIFTIKSFEKSKITFPSKRIAIVTLPRESALLFFLHNRFYLSQSGFIISGQV